MVKRLLETAIEFAPLTGFDVVGELVGVIQQLSVVRSLADIQEIVRTAARRLTGADGATFVLRDGGYCFYADEDAISPLWKGQRFPLEACVSGWAMQHREAVIIPDIYADPRVPHDAYRPTFVKSMCMVPIRTLDPVGAIGNYWARPHDITPTEILLLRALADRRWALTQSLPVALDCAWAPVADVATVSEELFGERISAFGVVAMIRWSSQRLLEHPNRANCCFFGSGLPAVAR
jgi:hypothetical protein